MESLCKARLLVIAALSLFIFQHGCGDTGTVSSITVTPANTTIGINKTQVFYVTATNSAGNIVSNVSPTWSVTGGIGSISSTGLFTAGSASGEGYVVAAYGTITGQTKVTVTTKGWLAGTVSSASFGHVGGIKVYLRGYESTLSTWSDSTTGKVGKYSIANIPPGTYEARTTETATYQVASKEVTIVSGETFPWDIELQLQPGVVIPTTTLWTPTAE
jgi:hypothetical protein